jgi:hypothetical protein
MCTASPKPYDDQLFDAISDFLTAEVVSIAKVKFAYSFTICSPLVSLHTRWKADEVLVAQLTSWYQNSNYRPSSTMTI